MLFFLRKAIADLPPTLHWGRGFGTYTMTCLTCGASWVAVAAVGTQSVTCPYCKGSDPAWTFQGSADEPPNDGAWLTGVPPNERL